MKKFTLAQLFAGICVALLTACTTGSGTGSADAGRSSVELTTGWKFIFGEQPADVTRSDFDESGWANVSIPHSWNRVGYYENDVTEHIHTKDNVDTRRGTAWYRTTFETPRDALDKRIWLEFDAASRTAEVWLNGQRIGEHRAPFTRFRFDITDQLTPTSVNHLVVKVNNSTPEPGSATADVLPIAGDFFVHGGLYRPVRLITTNSIHIDMLDHGGPGVYATTLSIGPERAEILVRSRLTNDTATDGNISVRASLIDATGETVAVSERNLNVDAASTQEVEHDLTVNSPVLWNGMENPYLYTLRLEVLSSERRRLDFLDQSFGIREIRIDPERGFILNGKPLRLHGVSYHQDREGRGWAVSRDDIAEDVAIMKEIGANTIRLAHYPHGQPIHEMANEEGFVLWDEIPLVTSWGYGSDEAEANAALAANAELQMKEMIRQNFNHPSVAVWGIANEADFGVVLPVFLGAPASDLVDPMPLLKDLEKLSEEEDPTRSSAIANCCEAREEMENFNIPPTPLAADVNGANRYYGWYYGKADGLGPHLDELRKLRPDQPLSVSEYGAGGAVSLHTDNPIGGPVDERGHDQPEEYMTYVHEKAWADIEVRPYLWASWVWNGFDFATSVRKEGDAIDINTKGLVTYDRKVRKDSFYFYKANWSDEPTVHIAGRRYVDRAYPVTVVRVFSNAPITELWVNGDRVATQENCELSVCAWEGVRLAPGVNRIEARGIIGKSVKTDVVTWELGSDQANRFQIDSGALIAAPSDTVQLGSDSFFEGGKAATLDRAGSWGRPDVLAEIEGTLNRELATTYREGKFVYTLPLAKGVYDVTLVFVEPETRDSARTFDVLANAVPLLESFDIAAKAGGSMKEVREHFEVNVTGSELVLQFNPHSDDAVVSAVLVSPAQ